MQLTKEVAALRVGQELLVKHLKVLESRRTGSTPEGFTFPLADLSDLNIALMDARVAASFVSL